MDCFDPDFGPKTASVACTLQWREVHSIIAAIRHVAHLDRGVGDGCLEGLNVKENFLFCLIRKGLFGFLLAR
jgi:hypothetical protein